MMGAIKFWEIAVLVGLRCAPWNHTDQEARQDRVRETSMKSEYHRRPFPCYWKCSLD